MVAVCIIALDIMTRAFPKLRHLYGVIFIGFMIAFWLTDLPLLIVLVGIYFYAFIVTESQALRTISANKHLRQEILFVLALIPIVIAYVIPRGLQVSEIFYVLTCLLALLASHGAKNYKEGQVVVFKHPPIFLGILFIIASGFLYYVRLDDGPESSIYISLLVLLFYSGGAMIIYMFIYEKFRTLIKTADTGL